MISLNICLKGEIMSSDPSDSTYDFVPVPRKFPPGTPPPLPKPVPLQYRRVGSTAAPAAATSEPSVKHTLSFSEKVYYWLRRLAAVVVIGLGAAWLIFIPYRSIMSMSIGCGLIGAGFAMFLFAGPTDAEKRGYHF